MRPGNRLRELRRAKGMTQAELADASGVSQPAISQIENGTRSMDIQWMRSLSRVLDCNPADFLERDDNPDQLTADERDFIARYRAADQKGRETLSRIAAAVVPDERREDEAA